MSKSRDSSPSSEGGFVFETTEFDVHMVDDSNTTDRLESNTKLEEKLDESETFGGDLKTGDSFSEHGKDEIVIDSLLRDISNNDIHSEILPFNSIEDSQNDTAQTVLENSIDDIVEEKLNANSNENNTDGTTKLPIQRIKTIMKCDPEVHAISARGVRVMSRATELFLQYFTKELYKTTSKQKKHSVDKPDIESTINSNPLFEFLDGSIDWKISE